MDKIMNDNLDGLDPVLVVEVARRTHEEALRRASEGSLEKWYLEREIYVPGVPLVDFPEVVEVSMYSDGFGSSIFIRGKEMVLLQNNHETISERAVNAPGEYLADVFVGFPESWRFLEQKFNDAEGKYLWNLPSSAFFFDGSDWYQIDVPQDFDEAKNWVDVTEFEHIFKHAGLSEVSEELIDRHLDPEKYYQ